MSLALVNKEKVSREIGVFIKHGKKKKKKREENAENGWMLFIQPVV